MRTVRMYGLVVADGGRVSARLKGGGCSCICPGRCRLGAIGGHRAASRATYPGYLSSCHGGVGSLQGRVVGVGKGTLLSDLDYLRLSWICVSLRCVTSASGRSATQEAVRFCDVPLSLSTCCWRDRREKKREGERARERESERERERERARERETYAGAC